MNMTRNSLLMAVALVAAGNAWAGSACCPADGQPRTAPAAVTKPKAAPAVVDDVLGQYGKIHAALAADSFGGVPAAARAIAKAVNEDTAKTLPAHVAKQADDVANAKDLAAARTMFKLLSQSLARYMATEKIQTGKYVQAYCSMAKAGWIQTDKEIKNPYYGSSMLKCGELVSTY